LKKRGDTTEKKSGRLLITGRIPILTTVRPSLSGWKMKRVFGSRLGKNPLEEALPVLQEVPRFGQGKH